MILRRLFAALTVLLLPPVGSFAEGPSSDDPTPLHGDCQVHFARLAEGRQALAVNDPFLDSLSRFDIECRLQKQGGDKRELVKLITSQVRDWEPADKAKLRTAISDLRERFQPYSLPFPAKVLLVQTSGREEAQAAYCRGRAIVLPKRMLNKSAPQLRKLLAHELFHVLSNQNPAWRARVYAIIGFRSCPEILLPPAWRERKITNPDAPRINNLIELTHQGQSLLAAPVLLASTARFDPEQGGNLFRYVDFRLLQVQAEGDQFAPVLRDGEPILHKAAELPDYQNRIGRNTSYIIHPDEILADNFALLMTGAENLPTPRVTQALDALLRTTTPPAAATNR